jgi:transcriptional regulator with XRE-family HTH domain
MNGEQLRQQRVAAGIAGALLSGRAGVDRARLSHIERGYANATADELARLSSALKDLITARRKVAEFAAQCGWPMK